MNEIVITNWRPFVSGTLRGFFSVKLPSGMRIHKCRLFDKNGSRWVNLPQETVEKDGERKYFPLIEFVDRQTADRFRDLVIDALKREGIIDADGAIDAAGINDGTGDRRNDHATSPRSRSQSGRRSYQNPSERKAEPAYDPAGPVGEITDADIDF